MIGGFLIGVVFNKSSHKTFPPHTELEFIIKYIGIKSLKIFFLVLCCIDCFFSAGVPAQVFLGISAPSPTHYGVPLVHGMQKAMQLLLFTLCILNNDRKSMFFIFLLLVPIIELNRASMVLYVVIYFSAKAQNLIGKKIINLRNITVILLIIFLWLILGNLRNTDSLRSVAGASSSIVELWLYPYLVSPIVNLSETIKVGYISLPHAALNAITGWFPFYQKFGMIGLSGGVAIVGMLSGILFGQVRPALIPFKIFFTTGSLFLFFGIFLLNNAFLFLFILLIICSKVKINST